MAGNLIPLDDAAQMLGKTVEELTDLRSRNEIFGLRDGASWKFKIEEINRFAEENGIEIVPLELADDLSSDAELIADSSADIPLEDIDGSIDLGSGSDINLSPSESHVLSGSDVEPGQSPSDTGKMVEGDDELLLAEDDLFGSDVDIGIQEDSDEISLDSDSDLSSDFDDDSSLMLDDDSSEIALDAADSGVNLSPTDSGLSLDEEPLELGGSDIDALELPEDSDINLLDADDSSDSAELQMADEAGLDIELPEGNADPLGSVQADNDFMLTPLEAEAEDESSGSQVIALEDSEIYADESSEIVSDSSQMGEAMQPLEVAGGPEAAMDPGMAMDAAFADPAGAAAFDATPDFTAGPSSSSQETPASMIVEQPIPVWMVAIQAICLIFLLMAGIIAIDLARNMFEFDSKGTLTARLTEWVIDFTGYFKSS
ncbi:MAG: helix-turn-helix domain-containing protein [Planctomycetota bacterium]|nr:helix-turn-helix domain-containing protein [Planctomycetota bacterium]